MLLIEKAKVVSMHAAISSSGFAWSLILHVPSCSLRLTWVGDLNNSWNGFCKDTWRERNVVSVLQILSWWFIYHVEPDGWETQYAWDMWLLQSFSTSIGVHTMLRQSIQYACMAGIAPPLQLWTCCSSSVIPRSLIGLISRQTIYRFLKQEFSKAWTSKVNRSGRFCVCDTVFDLEDLSGHHGIDKDKVVTSIMEDDDTVMGDVDSEIYWGRGMVFISFNCPVLACNYPRPRLSQAEETVWILVLLSQHSSFE